MSTARLLQSPDDDLEIVRLADDPADEDVNAAPTKVGPMSKAFVDQMMFKAQLAESRLQPLDTPASSPPESGVRPRTAEVASAAKMPASSRVPVIAEDALLPFQPTVRLVTPFAGPLAAAASHLSSSAPPVAHLLRAPGGSMTVSIFETAPIAARPSRDKRLAIEVAVCLGVLVSAVAGVATLVFP